MSETWLVVPDQHAHPSHNNDRADYLAKLTIDLRPDVVLNLGDAADMASLSSYDKGTRAFQGRNFKADLDAHLDFQERWWEPVRRTKKKMPYSIILEGNHEHRLEKALDLSPELEGTIGFKDFEFDKYYDEVIRYDGNLPGVGNRNGILFAHYFITGISGRPIGGEHPAHAHMVKVGQSTISAHSHIRDYIGRTTVSGRSIHNLVAGCYQDYTNDWAGPIGVLWNRGLAILRNVENGCYDFSWVSLDSLKETYG